MCFDDFKTGLHNRFENNVMLLLLLKYVLLVWRLVTLLVAAWLQKESHLEGEKLPFSVN